jgi:hypothetical protein
MFSIFIASSNRAPIIAVHVNLWNLNAKHWILDFGFHLNNGQSIELLLPFHIHGAEEIKDLLNILDENILKLIFNEHVSVSKQSSVNYSEVIRQDPSEKFDICEASIKLNGYHDDHTRILLEPRNCSTNNSKYLRIRINLSTYYKQIIQSFTLRDYFLNPVKEMIHYIDFRVNEIRFLQGGTFAHVRDRLCSINSLHYFIIKSIDDKMVIESPSKNRARLLEEKLWYKYLGETYEIPKCMIAYHWKSNSSKNNNQTNLIHSTKHYGFLAGFESKRSKVIQILLYLGIVIFIGIFTNLISDLIKDRIFPSKENIFYNLYAKTISRS